MVKTAIKNVDGGGLLGPFILQDMPSIGDDVTIPWDNDPQGVRIFTVDEICHVAKGVSLFSNSDVEPMVVLSCFEIR